MPICDFTYHRPESLAEACELAGKFGQDAAYLAGGTELLPDFKRGADSTQHLISLRDIPGIAEIRDAGEFLIIGAMATIAQIAESAAVKRAFPILAEAAVTLGGPQIRHQATIGGNFCRAVPCADTPPACLVGEAKVRLTGRGGDRLLPVEEFFLGPRQHAMQPGEIMLEILIPTQPAHSGASYQRFSLRGGSALAVAGVAARVVLDGDVVRQPRVALTAVAPVPLLATNCMQVLDGQRLSAGLLASAAQAAAAEAQPISDLRGSIEYRRQLVEVLTRRALSEAAARTRRHN